MRIVVVGAGVVGSACALALLRDGHDVALLDRGGPGEWTSYGPAGLISPASCAPLATPGVARQVPR
jgi:D-amino-acid dehydrogenase